MQAFQKQFQKNFHKFTNYTKNQKAFTIFLFVFTVVLLICPLAKLESSNLNGSAEHFWFIGTTFFRSMIIVFASMIFLLWWNINTRFKGFVVNFLGFRESEPMLNFIFLWVIASTFMGILDTLGMVAPVTQSASLAWGGWLMLILLVIGIIISFIEVWKGADKNSQRTKVLNIVDEEAPKKPESKRVLKHLFDVEEEEDVEE